MKDLTITFVLDKNYCEAPSILGGSAGSRGKQISVEVNEVPERVSMDKKQRKPAPILFK